MTTTTEPILYAEDEESDALLMKRAFKKAAILNPLVVLTNGQQVIDYLSGERKQNPLPRFILLDINLPVRSGLELLKWIRSKPPVCTVPVLVLTSSNHYADVYRAYLWGANGYLLKPGKIEELIVMVKSLKDYWLMHNRVAQNGMDLPATLAGADGSSA
jgi:CheY-like chemotaxis protein